MSLLFRATCLASPPLPTHVNYLVWLSGFQGYQLASSVWGGVTLLYLHPAFWNPKAAYPSLFRMPPSCPFFGRTPCIDCQGIPILPFLDP